MAARLWRLSIKPRPGLALVAVSLMAAVALVNGAQALVVEWIGRLLEAQTDSPPGLGHHALGAAPIAEEIGAPPVGEAVAEGGSNALAGALLGAAGVVVLVGFVKGAALFGQVLMTQRLAFRVIEDLQRAMFDALARADFARIAEHPAGVFTSRFTSDVERVREGVVRATTNLGRDLMTVIVMIAVMLYIDPLLTVLVLGVYPLIFQPVTTVGRKVRRAATAAQEQMGGLASFLTEHFQGVRMVKTYGLETRQTAVARERFAERFRLSVKTTRGRALVEPLLENAGAIGFAGLIAYVAWRVSAEPYPLSKVLGFVAALGIMAPPARAIGTLYPVIQEGVAALIRVFAIIDETPNVADAPDAKPLARGPGRVTLEDVRFAYPDGTPALAGLDIIAEPGAMTALVGPSGAGKSTVINLIARLYDADAGRIAIDGRDVRGVTQASLRDAIALVSQDAILFSGTIRENVAFGRPGADDAAIWDALDQAAARDFVAALPEGLDAEVGPAGARLSGGQRQRIALARAMLKNAPILLLDEPTSALDADAEAQVQEALTRAEAGRTTIVIAHRLATVRRADRIYVLENGQVAEAGDDASLSQRADGLYARLLRRQLS